MAERGGFEPPVEVFSPYDGLANRCFRPLSHLSAAFDLCSMLAQCSSESSRVAKIESSRMSSSTLPFLWPPNRNQRDQPGLTAG